MGQRSGMSREYWAHVLAAQPCREIVCCADGADIDQDPSGWDPEEVRGHVVADVPLADHPSVH
jgi:hypothetical protein